MYSEKSSFEMDWHPNGKILAVPTLHGISLLTKPEGGPNSNWSVQKLDEYKQEAFSAKWSANGRYLASGHADMHLLLWDATKRISIDRSKCAEIPLSLCWNKQANALLICLGNGRYAEWNNVIAKSLADPIKPYDDATKEAAAYESQKMSLDAMMADFGENVSESNSELDGAAARSSFGNSNTSNNVNQSSGPFNSNSASSAAQTGNQRNSNFSSGASTSLTAESSSAKQGSSSNAKSHAFQGDSIQGFGDDISESFSRPGKPFGRSRMDTEAAASASGWDLQNFPVTRYAPSSVRLEMQPSFMPSSSLGQNSRRILVWNHVGSIVARIESYPKVQTSMEMDFSDTSLYKPFSLTQPVAVDLATLGHQGVFTAAKSFLQFHMFQKFGAKSDWSFKLDDDGEVALSLAVGDQWSAVATSKRRLRLFGEAGAQMAVLALPGKIISSCAHGPLLAIFYHAGAPIASNDDEEGEYDALETQNIGWWVLHVNSKRILSSGSPLPLSPGATLNWCGFSTNEGSLCTFDSNGVLRQLAATQRFIPAATPLVSVDSKHAMSAIVPSWSDMWFEILDTNDTNSTLAKKNAIYSSASGLGDEEAADDFVVDDEDFDYENANSKASSSKKSGRGKKNTTNVWPIAVSGDKLRYIKCAREAGPNVQPKPVPSYLLLAVPFGAGSDGADSNENVAIRSAVQVAGAIGNSIDTGLSLEGALGEEIETEEDESTTQPKFILDLASDKQILSAQAKLDGAVLKLIREASQEGRVERALGLAKSLVLKKSLQVAIQVASKTSQPMLAEKIAEWAERRENERKRFSDATARMIAPPPSLQDIIPSQVLASLESQSLSLPASFGDEASENGRSGFSNASGGRHGAGVKRNNADLHSNTSKKHESDEEFEVESDGDGDEGDEDSMPISKKFATKEIDDDDSADGRRKNGGSMEIDDEEDDEDDVDDAKVSSAKRGREGSVFKSSPFSVAPPFAQTTGKLVDTLSSIGKPKQGSMPKHGPFQSPKKNLKK